MSSLELPYIFGREQKTLFYLEIFLWSWQNRNPWMFQKKQETEPRCISLRSRYLFSPVSSHTNTLQPPGFGCDSWGSVFSTISHHPTRQDVKGEGGRGEESPFLYPCHCLPHSFIILTPDQFISRPHSSSITGTTKTISLIGSDCTLWETCSQTVCRPVLSQTDKRQTCLWASCSTVTLGAHT